MSDWEASSDEESKKPAPVVKKPLPVKSSRFKGEDEEESGPVSDWEESSEEEESKPAAPSAAAPPKKKGTLKAKLAEKEAQRAQGNGDGDVDYDEDAVLDPREKARLDRERELRSDMDNAATLFGEASVSSSKAGLEPLLAMNPKTKAEFEQFSQQIIELVMKRHEDKPLYAAFVEYHVRALAEPLRDVDVRKAASGLTTLANEKQKEARDKSSGKKKSAKAAKPALGLAKTATRPDMAAYEEALDDFGDGDFM